MSTYRQGNKREGKEGQNALSLPSHSAQRKATLSFNARQKPKRRHLLVLFSFTFFVFLWSSDVSTLSHHIYHQFQAISTKSTQQPTVSYTIHRFLHFPIENPGFLRGTAAQNFNLTTKSGPLDIGFRKKTIFGTRFYRKNDPIFDKKQNFCSFWLKITNFQSESLLKFPSRQQNLAR